MLSGPPEPILTFSPTAWAKLLCLRDSGDCEVGAFGIAADPGDLLRITDLVTVKQRATPVRIAFDDEAVADFFDAQVDQGRKPEQFARIWCHSHPGSSPAPSATDEETFARVFGGCQWAVMFIIARGGRTCARLRLNVGPGGEMMIPVTVDYARPFAGSDHEAWTAEHRANVKAGDGEVGLPASPRGYPGDELACCSCPEEWLEELEAMDPAERRAVLEELSARPDLWGEQEGVPDGQEEVFDVAIAS